MATTASRAKGMGNDTKGLVSILKMALRLEIVMIHTKLPHIKTTSAMLTKMLALKNPAMTLLLANKSETRSHIPAGLSPFHGSGYSTAGKETSEWFVIQSEWLVP